VSGTCLVTALADREAELLEKARLHWPAIEQRFDHIAVHVTDHTNAQWCRFLDDRDVPTKSAKQGWNSIGLHRCRALQLGIEASSCQHVLYVDRAHIR